MAYTHEQIEQAIAEWQKRLRMQDWEFRVSWDREPSEVLGIENTWGNVYQVPGCKVAHICLAREHLDGGTPEQVSDTIAHEIIHMILEPLVDAADLALDGASIERSMLIKKVLDNANEMATHTLATAFSSALPPPDCLLDEPLRVTE
jgi:hypothetical protein